MGMKPTGPPPAYREEDRVFVAPALDLRLIADALPVAGMVADAGGAVTFVSRRWAEQTGHDAGSALGMGWLGAIDERARPAAADAWAEAIRTGTSATFEALVRTAAGSRWYRATWLPLRDETSRISAWLGTFFDVDDERRADARLRLSAEANAALAQTPGLHGTLETLVRLLVPEYADWTLIALLERADRLRAVSVFHRDPQCAAVSARIVNAEMRLIAGDPSADVVASGLPMCLPNQRFADVEPLMRRAGLAADTIAAFAELGVATAVLVPLRHRGAIIGVMHMVRSHAPAVPYDERDVPMFGDLAAAASTAIANAQIFDALLDSERHLAVVSRASDELARSLSLQETYDTFVRIVVPELADWASIAIVDRDVVQAVSATHVDPNLARDALRVPQAAHEVIRTGDPQIAMLIGDASELGLRSSVTVPLIADGATYGALSAGSMAFDRLFTQADLPLFAELARRASAAIGNARRFEQEHQVASALQAAALPKSLPSGAGYHFDGYYAPGRTELQIGGDWYDALRLDDGRIMISIGDVLGSGLEAATTMSNLRQVIRGVAQVHPDPSLMLDAADKTLRADRPDRLVTAFIGVLDPVTSTLTYASAGHPAALLRDATGALTELRTTGLPLGLRERSDAETAKTAIARGSMILCYTDGLIESTHDIFEGERRLRAALSDRAIETSDDPARMIHDAVLFDGAHDDVAILAVRTPGPDEPDPFIRFALRSGDADRVSAVRHDFSRMLAEVGADATAAFSAELVFGELIGNVARYAPGDFDVAIDLSAAAPVLHLLDNGPGFRFNPNLPDDVLSERGRGLYIVTSLAKSFSVDPRIGGGSHARAVLDIRPQR
jgi:PAS domain S-box-containing protein